MILKRYSLKTSDPKTTESPRRNITVDDDDDDDEEKEQRNEHRLLIQ